MSSKSKTVQVQLQMMLSSAEEKHIWSRQGEAMEEIRLRADVAVYKALPAVIHWINLELAMETVWMSSKLVCCLSHLCLAAKTLSSHFLLHCVDLKVSQIEFEVLFARKGY